MTLEKYKELKEEFYKKELENYKNTLKLFKDKDIAYENYIYYTVDYSETLVNGLYNLDLQELKSKIDDAVEILEELNSDDDILVHSSKLDVSTYIDSYGYTEVDDVSICVNYTKILSEDEVNSKIYSLWVDKVSRLLKPEGSAYPKYFDGTLLKLFETGNIDWYELQICVYGYTQ